MMKKLREEQQKEEQSSSSSNNKKGEQFDYLKDTSPAYLLGFSNNKVFYVMIEAGSLRYFHSKQLRPPITA